MPWTYEKIKQNLARRTVPVDEPPAKDEDAKGLLNDDDADDNTTLGEIDDLLAAKKLQLGLARWRRRSLALGAFLFLVCLAWLVREIQQAWPEYVTFEDFEKSWNNLSSRYGDGRPERFPVQKAAPVIYSPLSHIGWKPRTLFYHDWNDMNIWKGVPTDEDDARWERSARVVGIIKISGAEARQMMNNTLPIPGEEDSYIVGLQVYHQLHCLERLRQVIYPSRYGDTSEMNHHEKENYYSHLDHCVEMLKETLECHGDITPIPYSYFDQINRVGPDAHVTHMCRDMDAVDLWASAHEYNPDVFVDKFEAAHGKTDKFRTKGRTIHAQQPASCDGWNMVGDW